MASEAALPAAARALMAQPRVCTYHKSSSKSLHKHISQTPKHDKPKVTNTEVKVLLKHQKNNKAIYDTNLKVLNIIQKLLERLPLKLIFKNGEVVRKQTKFERHRVKNIRHLNWNGCWKQKYTLQTSIRATGNLFLTSLMWKLLLNYAIISHSGSQSIWVVSLFDIKCFVMSYLQRHSINL